MNAVWIVLPILIVLMFELGLTLRVADFRLFSRRPRPIIAGLLGQIVLLPALGLCLGHLFDLDPVFFVGLMLVTLSPGGSSSNIFSMLAGGDVALSVSLTAFSSVITLFTIPLVLPWVMTHIGMAEGLDVHLPVGSLIVQNVVLMLLPIVVGIVLRSRVPRVADALHRVLSRIAFPALILLAGVFFVQHYDTILANIGTLGLCTTALLLLAMGGGILISKGFGLGMPEQRTLVIEIGMQNAAQAIAIAGSPFVLNNDTMAIPAIVYALMMNVVLLTYVAWTKRFVPVRR